MGKINVIRTALQRHIPVAIVLAGGYAENADDTVTIHCNTAQVARTQLERVGPPPWPPATRVP